MATPNSRTLSVEFLTEFIRIYKSHPALWKVKSKEYANKYLKKNGYEELVQLCKSAISTADKDFVVRKINSLRGAFRKEHQKVRKSLKSGNSDEMYVPNLWYYNLLLFTVNQDKDIADNKSDLLNKDDSTDSTDDGESERIETLVNKKPQRKRNIKEEFAYIIQTQPAPPNPMPSIPDIPSTTTPTNQLNKEDEYDAFGFVVAAKLRKMSEDQRIHAEFLINQIIHKGLLNNLSTNTNIEDG